MKSASPFKTENIKIAIVDDEEIMRRLVSDVLKMEGYEIESFASPKEALEKIKTKKFDLILTDIKMPEMDGIELIKRVHQQNPETGVIFMTGYADVSSAKEAVKEGAYDYILKPFDLNEIRKSVAQAIEKKIISEEKAKEKGIVPFLDLNLEIYQSGDKDSLLKLALSFALIYTKIPKGSILLWDSENQKVRVFLAIDFFKAALEEAELKVDRELAREWFEQKKIIKITNLHTHPVFSSLMKLYPGLPIWDKMMGKEESLFFIPVARGRKVFELLNINQSREKDEIPESSLKFLAFVVTQTALAIENLLLLEDSERTNRELERFQEQTIQLERMVTKTMQSSEIGHELNNYLSVVISSLQGLTSSLDKDKPEKRKKYIDVMEKHLWRMANFVSGLMNSNSLRTDKRESDLNKLIQETLSFLGFQNRFKNISIETRLESKIPPLFLDAGQIQQLLYNLLNNAADAMGKRTGEGGTIKIETSLLQKENLIEIKVTDTGKGMSEDQIRKALRTRFTTKESGHGFGLLVCRRIVENHQGEIEVESQPEHGTIFRIRLPLRAIS